MLIHAARFLLVCEVFDSAEASDLRHASQVCRCAVQSTPMTALLCAPCDFVRLARPMACKRGLPCPGPRLCRRCRPQTTTFACRQRRSIHWKAVPQWSRPPDRHSPTVPPEVVLGLQGSICHCDLGCFMSFSKAAQSAAVGRRATMEAVSELDSSGRSCCVLIAGIGCPCPIGTPDCASKQIPDSTLQRSSILPSRLEVSCSCRHVERFMPQRTSRRKMWTSMLTCQSP